MFFPSVATRTRLRSGILKELNVEKIRLALYRKGYKIINPTLEKLFSKDFPGGYRCVYIRNIKDTDTRRYASTNTLMAYIV